jgi:hypothetical protein
MAPVPAESAPIVSAALRRETSDDNGTTNTLHTTAPTIPGTMHDQKADPTEAHWSGPARDQCTGTREGTVFQFRRTMPTATGGTHASTAAITSAARTHNRCSAGAEPAASAVTFAG